MSIPSHVILRSLTAFLVVQMLPACLTPPASVSERGTLPFQEITSEQVLSRLEAPGWLVVDIRDSNAYNGWPLGKTVRGGHISGAENLSLSWVRDKTAGLDALIEAKGIRADLSIIVYGDAPEDCVEWSRWLRGQLAVPTDQLYIYSGGFSAWSANRLLPVETLPRYEKLVHPRWVAERTGERLGTEMRIVEVSWRGENAYRQGHIPGAVYLDTDDLESLPLWNVVPAAKLESALLAKGITRDTLVVVCGKDITPATRAALILMYAGVKDVRLLNGGYEAWLEAGLPVEKGTVEVEPAADFGAEIPAHPEYLIGADQAREIVAAPRAKLISTRTWPEFTGEISGYRDIQAKGRIPGAVWGFARSSSGDVENHRNPDHTMRSAREIQRRWRRLGISPDQRLSFYCGTGWRASEVFFHAYIMGFSAISVYDGGWLEWSRDGANPIAVGDAGAK